LPAWWTEQDLAVVIETFERHNALRLPTAESTLVAAGTLQAQRRRRVNVTCRSWDKLAKLCHGHARISVKARHGLSPGEAVSVSLKIPDEIVLAICGEVKHIRGEIAFIHLTGMTSELSSQLLLLCQDRTSSELGG
jgi:hypothetical protein